jgi:hypothetical protein
VNVIIAVRCAPVFAAAVTVAVPLALPEDGDTVAQEASELTAVQYMPDVTVTVPVPPEAAKSNVAGETVREAAGVSAACVTLTVRSMPPSPVKVIVAVRVAPLLLAAAAMVVTPLATPEAGETVAQASELLAVQLTSDVTATSI